MQYITASGYYPILHRSEKGCGRHLMYVARMVQLSSVKDVNYLLPTLLLYYKIIKTPKTPIKNSGNRVALDKGG